MQIPENVYQSIAAHLSVKVILNILAHLTHFAYSFFFCLNAINIKYFDACLSMQIQKSIYMSKTAYLWGRFLAHLAHLILFFSDFKRDQYIYLLNI